MSEYNSIKVSGLFRTKRQGMYVGNISTDVMEELQALMNTGKAQKNGVVLFMFKNQREGGPLFNLLADAAKPRNDSGKKKYRKPIDEDEDTGEESEPEEEEYTEEEEEEPAPKPKKKVKKPVRTDDDDF